MKIRVTKSDIAAGVRGDCWNCPVALAIRRASGVSNAHVHVGSDFVIIYGNRKADLPPKVAGFIRAFDRASVRGFPDEPPVKPFDFDLPDELFAQGGRDGK